MIDERFIARIKKLPLAPIGRGGGRPSGIRRKTLGARQVWVASISMMDEPEERFKSLVEEHQEEADGLVTSSTSSARWKTWPGYHAENAPRPGDRIIDLERTRNTATVRWPQVVLLRKFNRSGVVLFTEEASDRKPGLALAEFTALLKKTGSSRKVTKDSYFRMSGDRANLLLDLWPKRRGHRSSPRGKG